MISRAEKSANYLILVVFALFALTPILTILQAAFGSSDAGGGSGFANFADAWRIGHFGT